jgi:hypothetical protein
MAVALPEQTASIAVAPVELPSVNALMAVVEPVAVAVMVVPFGVPSNRVWVELLLRILKQPVLAVQTALFISGVVIAIAALADKSNPIDANVVATNLCFVLMWASLANGLIAGCALDARAQTGPSASPPSIARAGARPGTVTFSNRL